MDGDRTFTSQYRATKNVSLLDGSGQLAQYRVDKKLADGGFGEVFAAWDETLCRHVAIKRLRQRPHDQGSDASLLNEARLAASLQHPAFVKVFALERDATGLAIVMELVEGNTLRQTLQNGPLPANRALHLVGQIAMAMAQAHQSGLIHGDIKPSNLMLQPDGTVRILDFGLAQQSDSQMTDSVATQESRGTVAYMAPEQLTGSEPSIQSDVYALGILLYELLCGKHPFGNATGFALAAVVAQSNSRHWSFPESMPMGMIQLIRAMTARQSTRRLQSMTEVLKAIEPHLNPAEGKRQPATVPAGPVRFSRPCRPLRRLLFRSRWRLFYALLLLALWQFLTLASGIAQAYFPPSI